MKLYLKNALMAATGISLLAASLPASAQLGGLGGLAKRALGNGDSVSNADGDAFLTGTAKSTKNVMLSAAILSLVLEKRLDSAGGKARIKTIQGLNTIDELNAHRSEMQSDLTTVTGRTDLAGELGTAHASATQEQRTLTAIAVANLAIGIYRNTELAGKAPGVVKGVPGNPQLLTRLGQFKTAAGLVALQGKSLGSIAGAMPKLLKAVKVEMPKPSATTEPQEIDGFV